jgi:hypothetical protein
VASAEAKPRSTGIDGFAEAHGLRTEPRPELPVAGGLLSRDGLKVAAVAAGRLPGGEQGLVCHLTYTYRSDDTTRTVHRTAVVVRVPESIGFAPYLASSAAALRGSALLDTRAPELGNDLDVRVADGVDDGWLNELFSPALTEWVLRSPDDFEWELADGVLTVSRDTHLDKESELTRLCEDAAHLAAALREESLEEVDSGAARRTAAKRKRDPQDVLVASLLPLVEFERPPADVAEARPRFRELVLRHPSTYFISIWMTFVWTLVINVVGGGIFGLLLNLPNPGRAVLIFEACVLTIVGYFTFRHEVNDRSQRLSVEAFWREYARARGLQVEDPGAFAATHAKAQLPGNPARVLSGSFAGIPASLMVTGDGFKRGDSIALVGGPTGPVAGADFDVSAPGASAKALDAYSARLAEELKLDIATAPALDE